MSFNGTSEGGNRYEEMEDCGGRDCDVHKCLHLYQVFLVVGQQLRQQEQEE